MVYTEIKLIAFFVAKDGEAVYSQQKQDLELTVALLPFLFPYSLHSTQLPYFQSITGPLASSLDFASE